VGRRLKWPTDGERGLRAQRERSRVSGKDFARRKDDQHHERETERFLREAEATATERTNAVNRRLHELGVEYSAPLRAINDPDFFDEHKKAVETTELFGEWKSMMISPTASLTEGGKKGFNFEARDQTEAGYHKAARSLVALWKSPLSKLRFVRVRTSRGKK
jgi:hypothetical protein